MDSLSPMQGDGTAEQEMARTTGKAPDAGKRPKLARPTTMHELVDRAYREEGRRFPLARKDFEALQFDDASLSAELELIRKVAPADAQIAVPPTLLGLLAELGAPYRTRERLLRLVIEALAHHPVFVDLWERLVATSLGPEVTAAEVSRAAEAVPISALNLDDPENFTLGSRERLRLNSVVTLELLRTIRERRRTSGLFEDMANLVWTAPLEPDMPKLAAVLTGARSHEALAQVCRYFEGQVADERSRVRDAHSAAAVQSRRLQEAEDALVSLHAAVEEEHRRTRALEQRMGELQSLLAQEQSNRVVDKSHLVDDYEVLRTQVVRKLRSQSELLADGLHALRNGSSGVAEEFVDRALAAINSEIENLKDSARRPS